MQEWRRSIRRQVTRTDLSGNREPCLTQRSTMCCRPRSVTWWKRCEVTEGPEAGFKAAKLCCITCSGYST